MDEGEGEDDKEDDKEEGEEEEAEKTEDGGRWSRARMWQAARKAGVS